MVEEEEGAAAVEAVVCHAHLEGEGEGGVGPSLLAAVAAAVAPNRLAAVAAAAGPNRLVAGAVSPSPLVAGAAPHDRPAGVQDLLVAGPGLLGAGISLVPPVGDRVLLVATAWHRGRARDPLAEIPGPAAGGCLRNPQVAAAVWPTVLPEVVAAFHNCPPAAAPAGRVQELTGRPSSPPGLAWRIVPASCQHVLVQASALVQATALVRATAPRNCPPAPVAPEWPSVPVMLADLELGTCPRSVPARAIWVTSWASPQEPGVERPSRSFPPSTGGVSVPRNSRQVASGMGVPGSGSVLALARGPGSCPRVQSGLKTGPTGGTGRRIEETTGRTG